MTRTIRPATEADLPQVRQIFAYYVLNTVVTLLVNEPPLDYIADRFRDSVSRGLPYLVAVDEHDAVLGYTYASAFTGFKLGYANTVEISLFCHPDSTNRGIGSRLIKQLIDTLRATKHVCQEVGHEQNQTEFDVRKVIAVISVDEGAEGSALALRDWYKRWGFEEVARLKGVGFKKGRTYSRLFCPGTKPAIADEEAGSTYYTLSCTCSDILLANDLCHNDTDV